MCDEVILYDNNEAWVIKKHETNHINKDCIHFKFDGFFIGCSHELDKYDPIWKDDKKLAEYLFNNCNKNCKWKNKLSLSQAIKMQVDNLKKDFDATILYAVKEIERLELKKTFMENEKIKTSPNSDSAEITT